MSKQRRCDFTKCVDGKWYLTLGDHEHAYDDSDCTTYGPFETEDEANEYCRRYPNPGGSCTDDSGTEPVPANVIDPAASGR